MKKKGWVVSGVALALVGLLLFTFGKSTPLETAVIKNEDLVRTVKISGKVTPSERVDLAFETSGTVSSVGKPAGAFVQRGETLVRLDSGSIAAEIAKAEAELSSAQAELNKLEGTTVYENSITNAKRSIIQAIQNAYTTASDAVENKTDQVFINSLGSKPVIAGNFDGYSDLRDFVNENRILIGYTLEDWQKLVSNLTLATYSEEKLSLSKEHLAEVTLFITEVSRAVNLFEVTSYMSQADIDAYKAAMLTAKNSLNQASQSFIDAENSLASTLSDVPVQLARVEAARASVQNLRFKLGKTTLVAPFSGLVAKQDAKVGQSVTAGVQIVSVISQDYIIETFVPEVSIAGIMRGNPAQVTLDAYGTKEFFEAKVEYLDPAETVKDGVSTYKVKLSFSKGDERIRSGMTANVEIETLRKVGVNLIPDRTVIREAEETYVYVLEGEKTRRIPVTLGEKDSRGNVELLSGLTSTDLIVVNPEK